VVVRQRRTSDIVKKAEYDRIRERIRRDRVGKTVGKT
jgi:hypothetical protein